MKYIKILRQKIRELEKSGGNHQLVKKIVTFKRNYPSFSGLHVAITADGRWKVVQGYSGERRGDANELIYYRVFHGGERFISRQEIFDVLLETLGENLKFYQDYYEQKR